MEKNILKLIKSLLDDDHGVNEDAWTYLNILVVRIFGNAVPDSIGDLLDKVKATDGRYYLPK